MGIRNGSVRGEIGIAFQSFPYPLQELETFGRGQAGIIELCGKLLEQALRAVIDLLQNILQGLSPGHVGYLGGAPIINPDVHGVGVTKEVVHIPQDFLVGTSQEERQ